MIQDDDKLLQELFSDYKPELSDDIAFMDSLTEKLDKVEFIKSIQEAQTHRYKMAVVLSLVLGIIAGGALATYIILQPSATPLFSFGVNNGFLIMLEHNSRLISISLISLILSIGIISIISITQNLANYCDLKSAEPKFNKILQQ